MFPNLKGIYLYNNNIESIEVLSSMWMPSMDRLIFGIYWFIQPTTVWLESGTSGRHIGLNSSPFKYVKSKNKLEGNKIADPDQLPKLKGERMTNFALEDNREQHQCNDLSFVAKMETKVVKAFCKGGIIQGSAGGNE